MAKAKEFAEEIREQADIPVKVVPRIQGKPDVYTEFDQNMWHAGKVLEGIDDDD